MFKSSIIFDDKKMVLIENQFRDLDFVRKHSIRKTRKTTIRKSEISQSKTTTQQIRYYIMSIFNNTL